METKTIPVRAVIDLDLAQNFMLDGGVQVEPEKVRISGPAEEIDTIYELKTRRVQLQNLNSDFTQNIELVTAPELKRTNFSHQNVTITGRVIRFSEVLLEVPVTVVNLPENLVIKTFPPSVAVLCSGGVDAIKNLTAEGFKIEADYRAPDSQSGRLQLVLSAYPEGLRTVQLQEQSVEYIVRRE
jgi:YbbR domain-containing protein